MASSDAFDGVRAVKARHPDLILSEISLPNGAGLNFCEVSAHSAQKTAAFLGRIFPDVSGVHQLDES